jgi:hypothetical protein
MSAWARARLITDQLGDDVAESLEPSLSRVTLQDEITAFDVSEIAQCMHKGSGWGINWIRPNHF